MKKYLYTFFLLFLFSHAFPQQYGNEWINYSQQYFRIFVVQDGIYRIDSTALANAGINMALLNPKNLQLFGRGQEQYIYVKGESDGKFNAGDYIEFYGMHNDGWYDVNLYNNPADQPNPNYSMFNDTATYYLTINPISLSSHRMILENDINFSSYNVATYFNKVSRDDYTGNYFYGKTDTDGNGITESEYVNSEGWFDGGFSLGGATSKSINTNNAFSSGNAIIDFMLIGASNYASAHPNHHVKIIYAGVTIDETLDGYYSKHYFDTIPASSLGTSTSFNFTSINDLGSNADYNTIAYINVKYPHTLNMEDENTYILYVPDATGQTKTYFNLSNFNVTSGDSVRFYDLTNHKRIKVAKSGSNYQVLIPNSSNEKKCYLTSEGKINHVTSVTPVSYDAGNYAKFRDFTTPSILASDYIIVSHKLLLDKAEEYRQYRATVNGGNFHPLLADVDDLYDQFCYGIRKNPLAIKNFARFAYNNFNSPPKDLFLIGKGYAAEYDDYSLSYRKNPYVYSITLIPGFGTPPSDILYTKFDANLKQYIPTGRLAASSPAHVELYLNKVMDYEATQAGPPQEWMKNVLHFGGGADISQQNTLAAFLNGYKQILSGPYFGGYVRTFLKSSTDPIEQNQSDSLKSIINNGVSLMTFFGHGAGIGFDMSIDYPSAYDNFGKYPFLLALSCLAGDLYQSVPSSSEEFVLIQDKGVIGYLASVGKGEMYHLDKYANNFNNNIGVINYKQSVGKCIQNTIDNVISTNPNDFYNRTTVLEMTLHGDPAIIINSFDKPDYKVTPPDVYFTPANVTAQTDSFTVNIISTNIGKAVIDTFFVNVSRKFPNGIIADTVKRVKATLYKDTISFKIPVNLATGIGLNSFTVNLDCFNHIDEISETNNSTTVTLLITSNDITPVYPYEYAIVPSINVTLKASTGNPFASARDYIFEADTSDSFNSNSPGYVSQIINHSGGVVSWTPLLPITKDSIVYFWRVASTDTTGGGYRWKESSFQYITGKRGWGQSHFFQFNKDTYRYVNYNKPARKFDFINSIVNIEAQTGYYTNDNFYNWTEEYYKVNGALKSYWFCPGWYSSSGAVKIAVFDSISAEPWSVAPTGSQHFGSYGEFHCPLYTYDPAFDFYFSSDHDRTLVKNFLNNIPQNDYVLVMTHQSNHGSQWNDSLINAFRSIGSSISDSNRLQDNLPYIIIGQKGVTPGGVPELRFTNGNLNRLTRDINTRWKDGDIKSVTIGPAAKWDSLHWRVKSIDPHMTDIVKLNVLGIKMDGTIDTLIHNLPPVHDSMDISLRNRIDNSVYPYLKLVAVMKDDTFKTPSQMIRWQVMYQEVPETTIDPSINFSFYKDTLMEADSVRFSTAIHNISEYNMDSLLVHYWIIDANRIVHPVYYHRYRPHPAGDILIDTVAFSTNGLQGLNSIWIEANPNNDQLEQYHFNNIGEVSFCVDADRTNPLLDVTFDGIHILDGDIVSAKPLIEVRLKDENKFLLMNNIGDTSLFKIFIQNPDASTANRIFFTQASTGIENMKFYPATSSNDNKCRIEYLAGFPIDGTYKLIVQAKDKSNNKSGDFDYEINFEVINKSTITEVMNWPNPFSTSTRFVFTLTGSEIPTYFKIQIMTITGKAVREIGMEDLGNIHIGRNITQYAWDGKDDYGDQLANGVYLYRVITNINGKTIEKNATSADKYFKEEFGKMFLMR